MVVFVFLYPLEETKYPRYLSSVHKVYVLKGLILSLYREVLLTLKSMHLKHNNVLNELVQNLLSLRT